MEKIINRFYCNQMYANYKNRKSAVKRISSHYTSSVDPEKYIKLIIYNKRLKASNQVLSNSHLQQKLRTPSSQANIYEFTRPLEECLIDYK